jgi:hypothetical protein
MLSSRKLVPTTLGEISMISLSSLIPNADDFLALEVEELAGVLLVHLNSFDANTVDCNPPQ